MPLNLIKTMRPKQWAKSIFIFTALVFDRKLLVMDAFLPTLAGAALFSLVASAVYIFNDIADSNPPATFSYLAEQLNKYNLAYLHVVEGDMITGERHMDYRKLRDTFNSLYMANNGYDYARATQALANGDADLVSFGKLYIANPDLPERFKQGAALNEPDEATFYGGDERGYTDYPTLS